MNVLLSIKPKYVEKILNGEKKFEFRKIVFREGKKVERVYIYSTSPVKKIVAYFTVEKIIEDEPERLWERCSNSSGIDEDEFFNYFENKEKGYAIKINNLNEFEEPVDPKSYNPNFRPPQSFYYTGEGYM
ncbi:MAG: hypothetical protein R6W73_01000 [Candidatus Saliniplasma sp.]